MGEENNGIIYGWIISFVTNIISINIIKINYSPTYQINLLKFSDQVLYVLLVMLFRN